MMIFKHILTRTELNIRFIVFKNHIKINFVIFFKVQCSVPTSKGFVDLSSLSLPHENYQVNFILFLNESIDY